MQPSHSRKRIRTLYAVLFSLCIHFLLYIGCSSIELSVPLWTRTTRTIRLIPLRPKLRPKPRTRRPQVRPKKRDIRKLKPRRRKPKPRPKRRRVRPKRRPLKRSVAPTIARRRSTQRRKVVAHKRKPPSRKKVSNPQKRPKVRTAQSKASRQKVPLRRKRNYKLLDLRPSRLPSMARSKRSKKHLVPWAGNSRFARTMRAYHNRWMEDMRDRRGLVDEFFGTAGTQMDRCLELWVQRNFKKHLTPKEMIPWVQWKNGAPRILPQWTGMFSIQWDRDGRVTVRLKKSKGLRKLDHLLVKTAKRCLQRIQLPKRFKGKLVQVLISTSAAAYYKMNPKDLIGLREVRDPQTGGVRYKFSHIGEIVSHSNTMVVRQRTR